MKISAVIAEFNPFHNGHEYLLKETKKNSDAVVCIMSGSFVQRGKAAIFDKWTRAKAAVMNGADLVVELPVIYSASTAERFAYGAVALAKKMGCINEISFGSECGNIRDLQNAAELILNEPREISLKIKNYLASGLGFPAARQYAYKEYVSENMLTLPNNILAIEYIKAAKQQQFDVKFNTLHRTCGYHDTETYEKYASASAIRKIIRENGSISAYVPQNLADIYRNANIYNTNKLGTTAVYLLRSMNSEQIKQINDVSEGLENLLKKAACKCDDFTSLINYVSCKRYTKTKISRILISLLLGIDKNIIYKSPSYVRILAFNDTGRKIIKTISENAKIIVKVADFTDYDVIFEKDILSTDIAALCTDKKISGADYTTPPVYVSKQFFTVE